MNKRTLFEVVRNDYEKYISFCTQRFYDQRHHYLDFIYGKEDIEQLIYIQIWEYIGRYNKNKSTLKSYIVMMMKTVFCRCMYLSGMEKRQTQKAYSLHKTYQNYNGDTMTLEDTLVDTTLPDKDDNLSEFFYKQILRETYKRVYDFVKQGYTYREVGKKFNVSHQRIGQIMQTIGKQIRKYES